MKKPILDSATIRRIAAIEKLIAKATDGPWEVDPRTANASVRRAGLLPAGSTYRVATAGSAGAATVERLMQNRADAAFIADARQSVPWLIEMVRKLSAAPAEASQPNR